MPGPLDRAMRRLLCQCFPADAQSFGATRAWHGCVPAWTVVVLENEEPVACAAVVERAVTCGGVPMTVAGVGNFCVAPPWRGSGLAQGLMERIHAEARARGMDFGLLFCSPGLEGLYAALGWSRVGWPITALDERGLPGPLPAGNIGMSVALGNRPWPEGPVDLQGRDW